MRDRVTSSVGPSPRTVCFMANTPLHLRLAGPLRVGVSHQRLAVLRVSYAENYAVEIVESGNPYEETVSNESSLVLSWETNVPAAWSDALTEARDKSSPPPYGPDGVSRQWWYLYPAGLQQFVTRTRREMHTRYNSTYRLLRWRHFDEMIAGSDPPQGKLCWSLDRASWSHFETDLKLGGYPRPTLRLEKDMQVHLQEFVDAGEGEPLGRQMWHRALNSPGPIALILAVSAVEIETKKAIAQLIPRSDWLVRELPTPPVVRLIRELLPALGGLAAKYAAPAPLLKSLERAIHSRNRTLHVGPTSGDWDDAAPLDTRSLLEVLVATSDALWLLDVYRGHEWALALLSNATRQDMSLPVVGAEDWAHDIGLHAGLITG
jgi:hypothetical protein